jgi:CubicO group peptidase (beta-lactamase class C family)
MVANGGQLGGVRILAPRTVRLMTTNQVDTLLKAGNACMGFGLTFGVHDRFGCDDLSSEGTYFWGGAYGSSYMVDPQEHLIIVYMENRLPRHPDVGDNFRTLVYQALVEPRT